MSKTDGEQPYKQLKNKFEKCRNKCEKCRKLPFLTPNLNSQNRNVNLDDNFDFWVHLRSTRYNIELLALKKI